MERIQILIFCLVAYAAATTALAYGFYRKYQTAKDKVNAKCKHIIKSATTIMEEVENQGVGSDTISEELQNIMQNGISTMLVESEQDKRECITGVKAFCDKKVKFTDIYESVPKCMQTELRMCGNNGVKAIRFQECGIYNTKEEFDECHKNNLKR